MLPSYAIKERVKYVYCRIKRGLIPRLFSLPVDNVPSQKASFEAQKEGDNRHLVSPPIPYQPWYLGDIMYGGRLIPARDNNAFFMVFNSDASRYQEVPESLRVSKSGRSRNWYIYFCVCVVPSLYCFIKNVLIRLGIRTSMNVFSVSNSMMAYTVPKCKLHILVWSEFNIGILWMHYRSWPIVLHIWKMRVNIALYSVQIIFIFLFRSNIHTVLIVSKNYKL